MATPNCFCNTASDGGGFAGVVVADGTRAHAVVRLSDAGIHTAVAVDGAGSQLLPTGRGWAVGFEVMLGTTIGEDRITGAADGGTTPSQQHSKRGRRFTLLAKHCDGFLGSGDSPERKGATGISPGSIRWIQGGCPAPARACVCVSVFRP